MTEVEKQSLSGQEIVHSARPTALVAGGRGVGDILRLTPLIRVFARLGYEVDVLVAPDYPKTLELLEGAPEIRNLFYLPSTWRNMGGEKLAGLEQNYYDIAAITFLATLTNGYQNLVRARRTIVIDRREWWREGDIGNAEKIAREVGWEEQLPPPFAMASERKFNLPAGTVAMHPDCKPDWGWKKWHGFDELAAQFPAVAIIGMPDAEQRDHLFQAPLSMACARAGFYRTKPARHNGLVARMRGDDFQRFRLDALKCGNGNADVRHLWPDQSTTRGDAHPEHVCHHKTTALRTTLSQTTTRAA